MVMAQGGGSRGRSGRLWLMAVVMSLNGQSLLAQEYVFDKRMLGSDAQDIDLTVFEQGAQLPGIYRVTLVLNGERLEERDVAFSLHPEGVRHGLQPCLGRAELERHGVKVKDYPGLFAANKGHDITACAQLSAIPQAAAIFQFNQQQLLLSIPQIALQPMVSGGIAPQALWDDGMTALRMNYRASATRTDTPQGHSDALYVQLAPGLNVGGWRLRNLTTWQRTGSGQGDWSTPYTYAERGLYDWQSRLTLGERYTPSGLFDGVPFRGGMLASDDAMVPYQARQFAPVVRGIARTQARVEVTQNGYTVYNATVAPGAFALTDLASIGAGGDLQVTVWETDGAPQRFVVPFNTPAIALRQGYLDYHLMGGQYRPSDTAVDSTMVAQGALAYGLPWGLTAFGGGQWASPYQSVAAGIGANLGWAGAVSLDAIHSRGQRKDLPSTTGEAWRVRYNKSFDGINTHFSLASYQYASPTFDSLSDVLDSYRAGRPGLHERDRRKARTTLQLNQGLGQWGSINLHGSREQFWQRPGYADSVGVGYNVALWRDVSMSLNWTQHDQVGSALGAGQTERLVSLWLSMPVGRWLGGNSSVSYQLTSPSKGSDNHELGVQGEAFERQLSWDVRQRYQPDNRSARGSSALNLTWRGAYGEVVGNYSASGQTHQFGGQVAGGMLLHEQGLTLSQPLGDTVALVAAPGAAGVQVDSWPGMATDFRGYTAHTALTPYQENRVTLNPATLMSDIELPHTDTKVVPTQGAVVHASFDVRAGGRALVALHQADGQVVPFGSVVGLVEELALGGGVVGLEGEVYLTGLPQSGQLRVRWGPGSHQQCQAHYELPATKNEVGMYAFKATCH